MATSTLCTSLFSLALVLPSHAFAQETTTESAPAADTAPVTEVVVTGTRIKSKNLTSASPVTTITAADVKATGVTRTEDMVNNMPQVFAADTAFDSNGASGTATVNLRGLGTSRTLVLLNGSRMAPGSPVAPSADLNQIPAALIDHVDLLTGGASAVYGSDAMAGVVNFVLKKHFTGVQLDFDHSFYQHKNDSPYASVVSAKGFALPKENVSDGEQNNLTLTMGADFAEDKGNAVVYFDYRKIEAVTQAKRDYSACTLSSFSSCGGSSTTYPGRFYSSDSASTYPSGFSLDSSGNVVPYTSAMAYNYGPINYYQRPDEKYGLGAFVTYNINDTTTLSTELMFNDDHTVGQIAASGAFYGYWTINCDNPLMSSDVSSAFGCTSADVSDGTTKDVLLGRRFVESGGRQYDIRHTSYRLRESLAGDINDAWSYDASAQYSMVNYRQTTYNEYSNDRIQKALDVVDVDGTPTCQSVVDGTDPNCVPLDIYSGKALSQEALDYVSAIGTQWGGVGETILQANLAGNLEGYGIKSPWANNGVNVSLGLEYRRESLEFDADDNLRQGLLAGAGGTTDPVSGSFEAKEIYGEAIVPIVDDAPWAKALSVELGYRSADYSTAGTVGSWKAMAVYKPIADLTVRLGKQRAVRAPSILELYSTVSVQLGDYDDPCAVEIVGSDTPSATLEQCQRTGVTSAQYGNIASNSAQQYNVQAGGNTSLTPETGDTTTIGMVYTPSYLPGFNASIDYFDIDITNVIGTIDATTILDNCMNTGDSFYCSKIHRDSTGSLWLSTDGYIETTNTNTGELHTRGFDLQGTYGFALPFGRARVNYVATVLTNLDSKATETADSVECAGLFDGQCGTPNPKYRHKLMGTWYTPWDLDLGLTWRHYGEVESTYGDAYAGVYASEIKAYDYYDVNVAYTIKSKYTLRVGINNLLDKDPPVLPNSTGTNGNTYAGVYDALGRYVFSSLSVKF
ncbi:MAG: TonB-dependent receptor [Asticcacaulis sp.]|uniref:TonB-dependent receptor domain-containing protein n=1 Tax=Asticcacaulis sp. TaxID=1872648 RepID=UPI0039E5967D